MLSEQRKIQLDGIVKKMIANNESDNDIQFVVNDFKKLHEEKRPQGLVEKVTRTFLPKGVEGFAETLGSTATLGTKNVREAIKSQEGLDEMTQRLGEAILAGRKEGKDTSRLEKQYKINTGGRTGLRDLIGETADKSAKQIAGEALSTVGTLAIGASPGATIGKRLVAGATIGGAFGTAGALREDETWGNVVTSGLTGAVVGLVLSGALEGVGAAARKVLPKVGKHTFTKELQPSTKDLTKEVEFGFERFGSKVRNVKNADGSAVYKGTYETMLNQSKSQLNSKGKELSKILSKYDPGVKVSRSQAAGDIISQMQETFGRLSKTQLKQIMFEVNRMPSSMNATGMLKNKRIYDGLIPDSFWLKAGDSNVAFITQAKYILRDNLRKLINEKTDDVLVKRLNGELGIAMDVRHLASGQIARRTKEKISGEGGVFYKLIGRFVDDYIFNPAITTRASQATLRAGQKTGQTPLRSAGRGLLIKEATE